MANRRIFLFTTLACALLGLSAKNSFADGLIAVNCSTNASAVTACVSLSANATTQSAVLASSGSVNKVALRNVENTPISIQTLTNTAPTTLFGEIDNRGRAQDLSIDLSPKYDSTSSLPFMTQAPNSGSALIVADSVNTLSVSVNGYAGRTGQSVGQLCGARALFATKATTAAQCASQNSLGIPTGYFGNPICDSDILQANQKIALQVKADGGRCTGAAQSIIASSLPGNFCPSDHFYLSGRDGAIPPVLNQSQTTGDLIDFQGDPNAESPVRLRFLNKCVKSEVFKSCTITGSISIAVPIVNFSNCSSAGGNICPQSQTIHAVIGEPLTISPDISIQSGAPVTGCGLDLSDAASVLFPTTLSIDPVTCAIKGTPSQAMTAQAFKVKATNTAGSSTDAIVTIEVDYPTISNMQSVTYNGVSDSTLTAATKTVNYNLTLNDQTNSCDQVLADTQSKILPPASTCPIDTFQSTNCYRVIESNTQVRDVFNYYGTPSLTYSNPTYVFTEGQSVTIKPTSLSSANAGTPITNCKAVPDANSGDTLPPSFTINPTTCVITGTASAFEVSMRSFSISASDASGSSAPAVINISVMRLPTIATLTYGSAKNSLVAGQVASIKPKLSLLSGKTAITGCGIEANSLNAGGFPASLSIDPLTCAISGTPTSLMSSTAFTIIATNATGSSNSAVVFIEVLGAPVPSGFSFSGSGVPIGGSCPYAASGEVFEQATQQHVIEPYTTSISVSAEYEALNCMYGNCPGANDTYSFMNLASNAFAVESGEAGSFGGKASIFAYDVASTAFTFANGSNGGNGTVEIQPAKTIKYCAKVIDARGVNGAASAQTLAFTPSVDFQKVTYSTFTYSLPAISPSTAFPQRTQNQAIGVYKKLDTSVRDWIIKQYIEPRFQ